MALDVSPIEPDIQVAISHLNARIKNLREAIDKLRECRSMHLQQQQASELREDLDCYEAEAQDFELSTEDHPDWKTHRKLGRQAQEFLKQVPSLRQQFRAALLKSKREIDSLAPLRPQGSHQFVAHTVEEEISEDEKGDDLNEKMEMNDDHVMANNQNLTDALRRTAQTMQEELEKSVLATQILESSTATIRSSTLQQEVLDTVMDVSRQLVKALEQADWLDRMLMLAAVLFFALIVLFVLKQRIVDRGFRLVFWWTRFLPNTPGPTQERIAVTATTTAEATTTLASASMVGRPADEL